MLRKLLNKKNFNQKKYQKMYQKGDIIRYEKDIHN